jgi:hypothetical protein
LDTGGLAAVGCCPADSGFAALEEKGLEIRVKREEGRETGQKEERKVGKAERQAGARKAMKNTAVRLQAGLLVQAACHATSCFIISVLPREGGALLDIFVF